MDHVLAGPRFVELPRHPDIVLRPMGCQRIVIALVELADLSTLGQQSSTLLVVEITTANVPDQVVGRCHLATKRIGIGGVDARAEVGDPQRHAMGE